MLFASPFGRGRPTTLDVVGRVRARASLSAHRSDNLLPMPANKPLTIRIHIPAALARQLGARRKQTGQTLSTIVVQALERLLGDEDKTIFQSSTVDALMEGASSGDMTMGELKTHGDFGLGTFDGLDGEMIELDGKVFQVRADGRAHPVEDSARTPFATVSFFKADQSARLATRTSQAEMLAAVARMLPSENMF